MKRTDFKNELFCLFSSRSIYIFNGGMKSLMEFWGWNWRDDIKLEVSKGRTFEIIIISGVRFLYLFVKRILVQHWKPVSGHLLRNQIQFSIYAQYFTKEIIRLNPSHFRAGLPMHLNLLKRSPVMRLDNFNQTWFVHSTPILHALNIFILNKYM